MDTHHTNNHEHTRIDSQMHFRIKVPELHSKRAITPRGWRGWSNRHSFFYRSPLPPINYLPQIFWSWPIENLAYKYLDVN